MNIIEFWVYHRNCGDGTSHVIFFNTEGEALARKEIDEEEHGFIQRRPYKEALFLDREGKIIQQETQKDIQEEPERKMEDLSRYVDRVKGFG